MNFNKENTIKGVYVNNLTENISESVGIIFNWIGLLKDVNTTDVDPLINPISIYNKSNFALLEDKEGEKISKKELQKYSLLGDNGFFTVPKVIKR